MKRIALHTSMFTKESYPYNGPSLPMAETRMILFEVKSHTYGEFYVCLIICSPEQETDLVNKWLIHEIRSADTQIENVHFLHDGIIESIKKPRRVRYLNHAHLSQVRAPLLLDETPYMIIGKHFEEVQLRFGSHA